MARELGAIDNVDRFRASLLQQLKRLVRYDIGSWNVVSPTSREAQISAVEPLDCRQDDDEEILGAYLHQNPLVAAADPRQVLKFSDFITLRQLHRLELYDAVYRRLGVEHQMAFLLPAPQASVIGVALNRNRPDFSERDRSMLEAARPMVVQAYERAVTLTLMHGMLSALEHAADAAEQAILVLAPGGRIQFATGAAQTSLSELGSPDQPGSLPEPLASWSQAQRRRAPNTLPFVEPLTFATSTARFIRGGIGGFDAILIERSGQLSASTLRAAGLTRREAQVLRLVALGLSNVLIGLELSQRAYGCQAPRARIRQGRRRQPDCSGRLGSRAPRSRPRMSDLEGSARPRSSLVRGPRGARLPGAKNSKGAPSCQLKRCRASARFPSTSIRSRLDSSFTMVLPRSSSTPEHSLPRRSASASAIPKAA